MRYLILVLLLASVSQAGVRIVGNGGGYAEMQATLINNELSSWTKICLLDSNPCGLSDGEVKGLAATLNHPMNLGFQTSCTNAPLAVKDSRNIAIESCALYQENQSVSKDFSEIATLVLTARLMAAPSMNVSTAHSLAAKVFNGYTQSEQQLAVILSESSTVVHSLQVSRGSNSFNLVSLEGKTTTIDISGVLKNALTCEGSEISGWNLNLITSQELSSTKALVELEAHWQCHNQKAFTATVEVVYSTSHSEILPQTLGIRVVQKVAH